jgi:hypothetical protein
MKKYLILLFLIFSYSLFSEPIGEIEFIEKLNEQKTATYDDCVKVFCYIYKTDVTDDFNVNVENLKANIKKIPKGYKPERKLDIGTFSVFAMQYLKIESGLFYLASHSGRYAVREMAIRGLVPNNTSEWESLSGPELIRYIQKVVEYAETK